MLGGCTKSQDGSGVFRHVAPGVSGLRAFRFSGVDARLVEHAGEAGDDNRFSACALERPDAGCAGRAAGQDIVDQEDVTALHFCRFAYRNGASKRPRPCLRSHTAKARRALDPPETIDNQFAAACFFKFSGHERRLVEPAMPQPPAVERDGNDEPLAFRFRYASGDQSRQQGCQCDTPTVL